VATALFLYICLTCVMFNLNGLQPAAVTNIALCFGLTITVLVYSFAGISGANLNPGA
jgi:glycerol uptake facilitator-like aquaporin